MPSSRGGRTSGITAQALAAGLAKGLERSLYRVYNEAGHGASIGFQALPDLDANGSEVAIQRVKLEIEGWERDYEVPEPTEPDYTEPL
jgi:hypothetical protein